MSEDLISRQAAIDAICEHGTDLERRGVTVLAVANYKQVTVDLLENLPSAERRGRWIESEIENEKYVCSVCGGACWYYDYQGEVAKSNYCPNCGARMEEGE